jgi:erythromycin esterase
MAFFWGVAAYSDGRDPQMARNLVWLAREYFPGRKIIVWAHNAHIIRHWYRLYNASDGMGQRVWEVFGDRSFVITATAYSGQFRWTMWPLSIGSFTVVSDHDPTFELEELLAETGLEQVVVPLRNLSPGGDWLRSPIFFRPSNYQLALGTWPDHADAILFMRAVTPRAMMPYSP